jgi:hypothetical protein
MMPLTHIHNACTRINHHRRMIVKFDLNTCGIAAIAQKWLSRYGH